MTNKVDYFAVKEVKITPKQLEVIVFSKPSSLAKKIFKNSRLFYRDLLTRRITPNNQQKYQEFVRYLVGSSKLFKVEYNN